MTSEERIKELETELAKFKENGPAKLYYAVNRKSWELAELMNKINMEDIDLEDAKNKTADRLRGYLKDSADIAMTVKALGDVAGITGDQQKDIKRRTPISPQSIARGDVSGN